MSLRLARSSLKSALAQIAVYQRCWATAGVCSSAFLVIVGRVDHCVLVFEVLPSNSDTVGEEWAR